MSAPDAVAAVVVSNAAAAMVASAKLPLFPLIAPPETVITDSS
jgi:hypothetical protein